MPPSPGDVGMVCQLVDVYHDNKEERLYITSKVAPTAPTLSPEP